MRGEESKRTDIPYRRAKVGSVAQPIGKRARAGAKRFFRRYCGDAASEVPFGQLSVFCGLFLICLLMGEIRHQGTPTKGVVFRRDVRKIFAFFAQGYRISLKVGEAAKCRRRERR